MTEIIQLLGLPCHRLEQQRNNEQEDNEQEDVQKCFVAEREASRLIKSSVEEILHQLMRSDVSTSWKRKQHSRVLQQLEVLGSTLLDANHSVG
jgi:aspartyl-tRNA synthetase